MKKEKDKKKKRDQKQAASQAARQDAQPAEDSRPLDYFLSVAGGKWKLRILWALHQESPARYRALRSRVPGITVMMLSQSLRELTEDGLLLREQYEEIPPRVEYALSPAGASLAALLEQVAAWERQARR